MAWRFEATNESAQEAHKRLKADKSIPKPVVDYLAAGLKALSDLEDDKDVAVNIVAEGQTIDRGGNVTTASMSILKGTKQEEGNDGE